MQLGKKIILAHAISAQDPQSFYNQKEKFLQEYKAKVKKEVISIVPIMVGANTHAAQLIIVPAAYYELEFTEQEAKEFRLHQSLILQR